MPLPTKKRELLSQLKQIIYKLSDISDDVATLEIEDSDASSRRVRRVLIELSNQDIPKFKDEIANIRMVIHRRKKSK